MTTTRVWAWAGVVLLFGIFCLQAQDSTPQNTAGESSRPMATTTGSTTGTVVPRLVQFRGTVTDATGKAASGRVPVMFSLYELQEGGTPLWSETQNMGLDSQGRYTVLLGAASPDGLPLDLFTTGSARWLGVAPALPGVGEQPRILLVGVPYALKAADADTLGGLPATAFVRAGQGSVGTAVSSSGVTPPKGSSTSSVATTASNGNPVVVPPFGGGRTDFIPIWKNNTTLGNSTISEFGANIFTNGVDLVATGPVLGVSGTATLTRGATAGVVGAANSSAGVGGQFRNSAAGGLVLQGVNGSNQQVFSVDNTGNVRASAYRDLSGNPLLSGLHGVREFFTNGTFRVPPNVTGVLVEMWGGGGGGSSQGFCSTTFDTDGGNGGGGAWTKEVLPVVPGATYTVVVGLGGSAAATGSGGAGTNSQILDRDSNVLLYAGGGQGGGPASAGGHGANGAGGVADPNASISHSATSLYPYASGHIAGPEPADGSGALATGGYGGISCAGPGYSAYSGGSGYVSLEW